MIQDLITGSAILITISGAFVYIVINHLKKIDPYDPRWCKHAGTATFSFYDGDEDNGILNCDDCGKILDYKGEVHA